MNSPGIASALWCNSPLLHEHSNMLGHYDFTLLDRIGLGSYVPFNPTT